MNLNMFDDIDGLILRERENSVSSAGMSDQNAPADSIPFMPSHTPLAMAYVPFQQWGDTKKPDDALNCGTLFSDLVYPFERGGGK